MFGMENDGLWRTVWRLRPKNNDKRTGSGCKWFLFIESLWGLMNSRISIEYVSIESRRDHELLIVIFLKFYKFPYSFLYYLDATTDEMHKRARHLVQYFCQWKHICFKFSLKKVKQFLNLVSSLRQRTVGEWMNFSKIDFL